MRSKNGFSRSFAGWVVAVGLAISGSLAMDSPAHGHFPFRPYGCFGWGSHHYGGYSSFHTYRSSYAFSSFAYPGYAYRSYSIGCLPRYYSVNYYAPTYFAPVYYSPVYYAPACVAPTYYFSSSYDPMCNSWGDVSYGISTPLASTTPLRYSAFSDASTSPSLRISSPLAMRSRSPMERMPVSTISVAKRTGTEAINGMEVSKDKSLRRVSYKPTLLQPYSPIWTKAAVGIVDEMVAKGELEHANSSCKSMERISQPKGAGVYLRQGILSYFSSDSDAPQPSVEQALNMLELACQAGSQLQPSELEKDSLRSYFDACLVDIGGSMDKLSQSVLESPSRSTKELLLLAALLKLDGQADRARLFAGEVASHTVNRVSLPWHNVLQACLAESL